MIEKLKNIILENERFVLTCHTNPDGDALGSTLGLRQTLINMGKVATVITPDLAPNHYAWMKDYRTLKCYERDQEKCDEIIDSSDVVFMMDYNDITRVKSLGEKVSTSGKKLVMIDHHTNPLVKADVLFSFPDSPATCEVIYNLLKSMGFEEKIDTVAATHFYTGIITDTGGLSYNSSNPDIYLTVAELLRKGVDKMFVQEKIFNNKTYKRLKLLGFSLSRKMHRIKDLPIAYMALSASELESYNYNTGDTEGFVNYPLQVKDLTISALIMERPDGIKFSLRSKGSSTPEKDFPVNKFAEKYYGGGGHLNAAGATFHGTFDDAVSGFMVNISTFYKEWVASQK